MSSSHSRKASDSSSSSALADPTRRFYTCKVNNITFEVDVRYTNLAWVGGGAYGAVCSADDSHPVRPCYCFLQHVGTLTMMLRYVVRGMWWHGTERARRPP